MNNRSEAQLAAALAISVSHIRRFRRRADRADAQGTNIACRRGRGYDDADDTSHRRQGFGRPAATR